MANKANDNVYAIAYDERDGEILRLEKRKAEITADINRTLAELAKVTKKRRLMPKKRRICPLLTDGADLDKI
jgi:hypothetical protein